MSDNWFPSPLFDMLSMAAMSATTVLSGTRGTNTSVPSSDTEMCCDDDFDRDQLRPLRKSLYLPDPRKGADKENYHLPSPRKREGSPGLGSTVGQCKVSRKSPRGADITVASSEITQPGENLNRISRSPKTGVPHRDGQLLEQSQQLNGNEDSQELTDCQYTVAGISTNGEISCVPKAPSKEVYKQSRTGYPNSILDSIAAASSAAKSLMDIASNGAAGHDNQSSLTFPKVDNSPSRLQALHPESINGDKHRSIPALNAKPLKPNDTSDSPRQESMRKDPDLHPIDDMVSPMKHIIPYSLDKMVISEKNPDAQITACSGTAHETSPDSVITQATVTMDQPITRKTVHELATHNGMRPYDVAVMINDGTISELADSARAGLEDPYNDGYRYWTLSEYNILIREKDHRENGVQRNWEDIAELLPGRSAEDCRNRWERRNIMKVPDPDGRHPHWHKDEEDILSQGKEAGLSFTKIAERLPARSAAGCRTRWREKFEIASKPEHPDWYKDATKKLPWTDDEDAELMQCAKEGVSWKKYAEKHPHRDKKMYQERHRELAYGEREQKYSQGKSRINILGHDVAESNPPRSPAADSEALIDHQLHPRRRRAIARPSMQNEENLAIHHWMKQTLPPFFTVENPRSAPLPPVGDGYNHDHRHYPEGLRQAMENKQRYSYHGPRSTGFSEDFRRAHPLPQRYLVPLDEQCPYLFRKQGNSFLQTDVPDPNHSYTARRPNPPVSQYPELYDTTRSKESSPYIGSGAPVQSQDKPSISGYKFPLMQPSNDTPERQSLAGRIIQSAYPITRVNGTRYCLHPLNDDELRHSDRSLPRQPEGTAHRPNPVYPGSWESEDIKRSSVVDESRSKNSAQFHKALNSVSYQPRTYPRSALESSYPSNYKHPSGSHASATRVTGQGTASSPHEIDFPDVQHEITSASYDEQSSTPGPIDHRDQKYIQCS